MTGRRKGIVILISGRGSNMQAIVEQAQQGRLPIDVRAIISNNPDAGIPTEAISHRDFPGRESFDQALMAAIDAYRPDLVVLAGFMRILGRKLVDHYAGRLINIHPALLPDFPGLDTHARALAAGHPRHGATVHFVINEVDSGPIIAQAAVDVKPGDDPDTLAARVLEQEHRIYPLAIRWFAEGRLSIQGGEVLLDGARRPEQGLVEPADS
jgi:phosphoribosylglycinamide formyltransferase-1